MTELNKALRLVLAATTKPTSGLNNSQFYGMDKKPGASAYVGGMQYNGTWRSPVDAMALHPYADSTAYVLFSFAQKPKVLRTTDLGQSWEDISGFGAATVGSNGFPDVAVYDFLVILPEPFQSDYHDLFRRAENHARHPEGVQPAGSGGSHARPRDPPGRFINHPMGRPQQVRIALGFRYLHLPSRGRGPRSNTKVGFVK
jgi:hypothetical protein